MYCQTQAINGYLARISDFPELSETEELTSDMVIETTNEMFDGIVKPAFMATGALGDAGDFFFAFVFLSYIFNLSFFD